MMINFKKGITLLETMIVLSIIGFLVLIILPSFKTMRDNQILKSTASDVFSALDKAKSKTLSSIDSSEYGVHFESTKIVIFKGTAFSSVDPNNEDILITSPATISAVNLTGGAVDLYFNRLSGAPNKTGTVTISISSSSKVITISATGTASMN
jgi:prepilin-type N-terminal cleavage/methylation domain-containing protein